VKGFDLTGSGFASRAELAAWLAFVAWCDDPDADPSAYSYVGGYGWAPTEAVELKRRARTLTPPASSAPRFLTLREAGALVRVAPETIRYWIWRGRLQAYKPGGSVLVREDDLLTLCNSPKTRHYRQGPTRRQRPVLAPKG